MERSLMATGIGGQGVQLGAQVIARAAIADGRNVMMFGSYGGMMRGGNTDATLVLSDGAIESPPVISQCWLGLAMHHEFLPTLLQTLSADSLIFCNGSVIENIGETIDTDATVIDVPATDIAIDVASLVCATMVMVGAVASATGLLSLDGLAAGLDESLPKYRKDHFESNIAAINAGFDTGTNLAGTQTIPSAWSDR
jgi:2-oxoglutarate ferredoxin oxidoreductase subunit gamma